MALRINTNVSALNTHRQLAATDTKLGASMEKLSSGYRINRASDDAAGLSVANRLRANTKSLTVASRNVSEASAMLGVAEGAANQIESILERMKELATQSASDNASNDRTKLDNEFQAMKNEITRIVNDTEYQGTALLTGTFGTSFDAAGSSADGTVGLDAAGINIGGVHSVGTFNIAQVLGAITITGPDNVAQTLTSGANGVQTLNFSALGITLTTNGAWVATNATLNAKTIITAGTGGTYQVGSGNSATGSDQLSVTISSMTTTALGVNALDLTSRANAQTALTTLDTAVDNVGNALGVIGSSVNRLNYTYSNLQVSIENFSASESTIRDADMASEMVGFTKNQILLQAGTAMLAQANQSSQNILSLFR